jgi:hypothetical protein
LPSKKELDEHVFSVNHQADRMDILVYNIYFYLFMPLIFKALCGFLIAVLLGSIVVVGYFGIGPMFAHPIPATVSQTPDAESLVHPSIAPTQAVAPTVTVSQDQVLALLGAVNKLAPLPPHENPQILIIQDKTRFASQPFFQRVENGDVLLTYNVAKAVFLYRPSTNQLVAQGTIQTPQASTSAK